MANDGHLKLLQDGIDSWNAWRRSAPIVPDLSRANLSGANLVLANLMFADLSGADLTSADLRSTNLIWADLRGVDLSNTNLFLTNLSSANLRGANLTNAKFLEAFLADANLASVIGLETCEHVGPSTIDYRTLELSGRLPLSFLRGVGLSEKLIHYLPSLVDEAINFYSCFISYTTENQDFAERIHADLQNHGVRCWFAPHNMPIGGKILDEIDAAIRLRDKVLLILSEHSIRSDWVEDEVTKAFEEERKRGQTVLFPMRLDDAVMETDEAWAVKLRARHIGDFRRWKDYEAYKKGFERVVRDLTVTRSNA